MPHAKLSERSIRDLKPIRRNTMIAAGVTGLHLRLSPAGRKTFVLRRQDGRRNVYVSLGRWPEVTLEEAQRAALGLRGDRASTSTTATVRDLAERFYTARILNRRKRNGAIGHKRPEQTRHYIDRDLLRSAIADLKLNKVRREHLAHIVEQKASNSGGVAANRLLAIIKRMFRYAVEVGLLDSSPAAEITRDIAGGHEDSRTRVLTDNEIASICSLDAATCDHAPLFKFLLLSGQRIGEAQAATWDHFDIDAGAWRIDENKSSRPHRVPISAAMKAIIEAQPRTRYESNTSGPFGVASATAAQAWLKRWCKRERIDPSFTPHDLRRTCATRMRDLGIRFDVIERQLNHATGSVAGVYQRSDLWAERTHAAAVWADEINRIVTGTIPPINVVDIGRAA